MKIVHVAPFYKPVLGGMEEVVSRIAEYFSGKHDVHVITYRRGRRSKHSDLREREVVGGVDVLRLKVTLYWGHGSYSWDLKEALKELDPQIVHVHAWRHPHVFQVLKIKKKLGFKAILHPHAPYHGLNQLDIITWLYHRFVDLVGIGKIADFDKVIALTPYERNLLATRGIPSNKIAVIPNGIPDELIKEGERCGSKSGKMILYLGRISKSKNLDLLIRAFNYLNERGSYTLKLVGPDEGLIHKLKLNKGIEYIGKVRMEERNFYYCSSDVFALPSLYEPFGITLLEAQAFGKPCVITGWGGQLYAAPPFLSSVLTRPDPKSFAEGMRFLLENPGIRKRLGKNGRKWSSMHTWKLILPKYEEVYHELAS